jgi:predicted MFS family arabinose efflux permease
MWFRDARKIINIFVMVVNDTLGCDLYQTCQRTAAALQKSTSSISRSQAPIPWHAVIAGLCANLVAIGLARFAYTPLLPALIHAHWFSAADAVTLGAANLAGYFAGALAGRGLAKRWSSRTTLQWMMAATSLAFVACAFPLSVSWYFAWRLISGITGGVIMVLVASTVLPHVPAHRRAMASGMIFLGLGLGIAGSGTLVPVLISHGLRVTWIGLGVLSAVLTAISWFGWPEHTVASAAKPATLATGGRVRERHMALHLLYGQFASTALVLVPVMVFLADFIARGLGRGASVGAFYWIVYGLGALAGPASYSWLADKFSARWTLFGVIAVQAAATSLLGVFEAPWILIPVTFLLGTFPPGIVPLVIARISDLLPGDPAAQGLAWSRATTMFALVQAAAGYALSWMFNASGGNHRLLFAVSIATGICILVSEAACAARTSSRSGVPDVN